MCTVITNIIKKLKKAQIHNIRVLGHDQIDEDSCISSLLLCIVLNHYGIDADFKILDQQIPSQTRGVLGELGYDLEQFQRDEITSADYLFLVDHHQTTHEGCVVGCIDHHPTDKQFNYLIYDNGNASACSKKIYDYMVDAHLPITKEITNMVAYALVIDTFDFKSPRGKSCDKIWLEKVVKTYDLDYPKMVNYALKITDLTMPIEDVAMCSLKSYIFGGKQVMSTYILVKEESCIIKQVLTYLQSQVKNRKITMWVFLTINVVESQTTEYRITGDSYEKIIHEKLSSRAQEIMPQIEKLFKK